MPVSADQITDLVRMYEKHGWKLRRILLSPESASLVGGNELASMQDDFELRESDLEALWFSRPPVNGQETWELRVLGSTPFALNEFFDEDDENEVRESAMAEVEDRIRARRQSAL